MIFAIDGELLSMLLVVINKYRHCRYLRILKVNAGCEVVSIYTPRGVDTGVTQGGWLKLTNVSATCLSTCLNVTVERWVQTSLSSQSRIYLGRSL